MKNLLSVAAGLAAGALAMYYLDSRTGARRRALVRDKVLAAGRDTAEFAQLKGKHVADRVKGAISGRVLGGGARSRPESDSQLHDRIRARLGHVVSHPKAVKVQVEQGAVILTGQVLGDELDGLLAEIGRMPGVNSVRHQLDVHESPQDMPVLQGLA